MIIELFDGPLDGLQFDHNADTEQEVIDDPRILISGERMDGEVEVMSYLYVGGGYATYEGNVEFEHEH